MFERERLDSQACAALDELASAEASLRRALGELGLAIRAVSPAEELRYMEQTLAQISEEVMGSIGMLGNLRDEVRTIRDGLYGEFEV